MKDATRETAEALVAQSLSLITPILRKQMFAVLEQMETEFTQRLIPADSEQAEDDAKLEELLSAFGQAAMDYTFARDIKANQAAKKRWDEAYEALRTHFKQSHQSSQGVPELLPELQAAFYRAYECFEDGEGYDVPQVQMQALAEYGVVRRVRGDVYETTSLGNWLYARKQGAAS